MTVEIEQGKKWIQRQVYGRKNPKAECVTAWRVVVNGRAGVWTSVKLEAEWWRDCVLAGNDPGSASGLNLKDALRNQ